MRREVPEVFTWLEDMPMSRLVSSQQVKAVIQENVVDMDVPGAVAEIAGEAATRLFTSEQHSNTRLKEILTGKQFEEFIDKLLELQEQRQKGLNTLVDLPIYQELISDVLYQAIVRYIYDTNILSKNVPGVASMLKMGRRVVNKTVPKLEGAVEESVKSYITTNLGFILHKSKYFLEESLTDEQLKASAMDLWDMMENRSLGEIQQGMDSLDLSEFVVLGYEFWLRFRQSLYFRKSYELIVDYLFERYGDQPFSVLLEDFAITPERILTEAERFAPQILIVLRESGQLEGIIRRRLETFYGSDKALKCLSDG